MAQEKKEEQQEEKKEEVKKEVKQEECLTSETNNRIKEREKELKEREEKLAKFSKYVIIFLISVLIAFIYKSCFFFGNSNARVTNYTTTSNTQKHSEIQGSGVYSYSKPITNAQVRKTEPIRKIDYQQTRRYINNYYDIDNNYLEEYLSDGDIDGINANDVKRLQKFLRAEGYRVGTDGIFRRRTKEALKAFQREYGIRADGILGVKTRRLINRLIRRRSR